MHAYRERFRGIRNAGDIAKDVNGDAADRRQEDVQIGARYELGKHAGGLLEKIASQIGFFDAEALRNAR